MLQSYPSSFIGQQQHLQGPESLQYSQMTGTFAGPPAYGNFSNPYTAMPLLSNISSGELKKQQVLSGYEIPVNSAKPLNKPANLHAKQPMTPQEKIVKLRRRQQMRAMLAIQKQQQQFSQQVACTNHSATDKHFQESDIQQIDGTNAELEDISTLPLLDPNSPVEQDDSNTNSVAVDYSAEDTILYRLQDIISKVYLTLLDNIFVME